MAKYYITTPIYYSNAAPHVGHAYTTTIADILARYHRLVGDEVFFLIGTADHGQKIMQKAAEQGMTPQALTDKNVALFKDLYNKLEISSDFFIRNSDRANHWPGAETLWRKLVASADIYKGTYQGLYCVGHEAFITEKELVDGKCPDHDRVPENRSEESYFFKLSAYAERLQKLIDSDEIQIVPESRKNEVLAFIHGGLQDVSFSRPAAQMSWGIPVPDDPTHTMYVWCEELSNYISAIGYGRDEEQFKKLWPAGIHVVGKDILRFHAVIWPAMLMSAGLAQPKVIFGHGLILSGGRKMSKTIGNVIDPQELIATCGADAVRYYFARHIPPFSDGDMTPESFRDAYNGNLANGLGNLVARVMKLAEDNLDGSATEPTFSNSQELENYMQRFEFNKAMDYIWGRIQVLDQRINAEEPFKLVKVDKAAGQKVISELVHGLYDISYNLTPFMPDTAQKIQASIRANKKPDSLFKRLEV